MNAFDQTQRVSLAPGVRWQIDRTTGNAVLLCPEGVVFLNETASEIVSRCDGQMTLAEVAAALAAEYETSVAALETDIVECLTELQRKKLIIFTT